MFFFHNDLKDKVKLRLKKWYTRNEINFLLHLFQFPDLNSVENLLSQLKRGEHENSQESGCSP